MLAWPPKPNAKLAAVAFDADENRLAHPQGEARLHLPTQSAEQKVDQVRPAVATINVSGALARSGVLWW